MTLAPLALANDRGSEPRPPTTDANTGPSPVDLARMAAAPATNDPARATWSSRPGRAASTEIWSARPA
jgi:hypothetical protein